MPTAPTASSTFEVAAEPGRRMGALHGAFETYRRARLRPGRGTAELDLFLLSTVRPASPPYYALGARFPPDRHAVFAMVVAAPTMPAFRALVAAHGGTVSVAGSEAELHGARLPPAYECAYNHTTLQALKVDRSWTYLQVAYAQPFDPAAVHAPIEVFGDDVAGSRVCPWPAASTAPSRSCWCAGRAGPPVPGDARDRVARRLPGLQPACRDHRRRRHEDHRHPADRLQEAQRPDGPG